MKERLQDKTEEEKRIRRLVLLKSMLGDSKLASLVVRFIAAL
jgi:hypothetical protein